ncbi:MAG: isochorismatase hydrolase [Dehalococcoidia bacterium]|nr:isochorismatase hydrolase [Dehalococcoidia bacterium]
MEIWDDVITERDRQVYEIIGRGARLGFGEKPALLIIDVIYNWAGDRPEPILESIKKFPASCGQEAWEAIHHIASLLPLAREKHIPVIYSTGNRRLSGSGTPNDPTKFLRGGELSETRRGDDIVDEIASLSTKPNPASFLARPW